MPTTRRTNELRILHGTNPYALEVQGKANEPICVAMLLDRARMQLDLPVEATLEAIYDRLENNAPRVAVITGSPDHPAHVMDHETVLKAAAAIWNRGGVPFAFGVPVVCDGTAQSTHGMCYSLVSRNLASAMVINQMEGHSYHGAFVI
ncbi:MAG TPA: dihydroxy-acid dehydratase, partial [bacterium]|nr:dihydroxy-acid dehydratase [bacterium]